MQTPIIVSTLVGYNGNGVWRQILNGLNQDYWCNPSQLVYSIGLVVYIVLTVFFAYFYTSLTFNPLEIANNMKKQGGFIPGIRPGKPTSDYLNKVLNAIIFIGAIGLVIVAVVPVETIIGVCIREDAKIIGITPAVFTFKGRNVI